MELNVELKNEHTDVASSVAWSHDCQLMTCADDKVLCKWGSDGEMLGKITTMSTYVTSISCLPTIGKQASDLMAVSCMDGTFKFMSRSGREEKTVKAHDGAVIMVRWSHDGTALVTGGEDGDVKIWSRTGNMRSTLVSTGQSIYSVCWGPDGNHVIIASGKSLIIKSVQSGGSHAPSWKNLQWDAHSGVVLCVDWNTANKLIVSGGEDCVYKVWDNFGRQLYCSKPAEHVITSVSWNPNGESFAVGTFNLLRLCDKSGWTHSRRRLNNAGSLLSIAWTLDGTQLAAAGGSGAIVFAQVVGKRYEWKNTEATLLTPRKLRVEDVLNETLEDLEFPRDRVVEVGLGYDWLVVMTVSQCYVYSLQNLNTPHIFDIRAPPHFIHMSKRYFMTLDPVAGIQVISYEGRIVSSPKFQGLRPEYLTREMVALSPDTVVIVDSVDAKNVFTIDVNSGKILSKLVHSTEVAAVALNQHMNGPQERILVFCDRRKDLFVASTQTGGGSNNNSSFKLHSNVESFCFNDETDSLVLLADSKLVVYYNAAAAFVERDLLPVSSLASDATEYGRNAQIVSFTNNRVSIRKIDGALVIYMIASEISLLYELGRNSKWDECLRLCRHLKTNSLTGNRVNFNDVLAAGGAVNNVTICIWALLASLALLKKQLNIAELCYAELNEVTKVEYLQYVQSIPSEEGRQAEMALFRRSPDDAERILLQSSPPLIYRAIKMNMENFRWNRALDLAVKYRTHLDTVLGYRQRYLKNFGKTETDSKFIQYGKDANVDWELIEKKEANELVEEEGRRGGGGRHDRK